ncbi:MAG: NAD(P)/FAD-dependent oxidoreductase, partial [Chloroflexota bacterium]
TAPHSLPGMEIISPRGQILRLRYQTPAGSLPAWTLPRRDLDAYLVNAAAGAGATIEEGFFARYPVWSGGVVQGVAGRSSRGELTYRAALTIIADGNRSTMAASLGLAASPRWPVRMGLVAHYHGYPRLRDGFGQMHVGVDGYCGIAQLPGETVNVAAVFPAGLLRRSGLSATQFLTNWAASSGALRETLDSCCMAGNVRGVFPVGSRTRRAWAPGALLAGDAVSFFDPFTGEGIFRAVRGAELASTVAGMALELRDVSSRTLKVYDALRTRAFRRKESVTALVQLFVQYPRLLEYAIPRLSSRGEARDALSLVLGDVRDARAFLNPPMLWRTLRP